MMQKSRNFNKFNMSCANLCGRVGGVNGVVLKLCSACQATPYCSSECQRAAWSVAHPGSVLRDADTRPEHKKCCSRSENRTIAQYSLQLVSEGYKLCPYIDMCLVKEFGVNEDNMLALARKPLFAQINVGLEPLSVSDIFELQRDGPDSTWNPKYVPAVFQVTHLAALDRIPDTDMCKVTPDMVEKWNLTRTDMDTIGAVMVPVALVRLMDGHSTLTNYCTVPLFPKADVIDIDSLEDVYPFMDTTLKPGPNDVQIAKTLNYVNTLIRNDKRNKLGMRAMLRPCDKELILDAVWSVKLLHYQRALRFKLLREPVYHSHLLNDDDQAGVTALELMILDHHARPKEEFPKKHAYEWYVDAYYIQCGLPTLWQRAV